MSVRFKIKLSCIAMGCKFIFPHHHNEDWGLGTGACWGKKSCKKSAANAMKCVGAWADGWMDGWQDDWMNGWLGKGEALRQKDIWMAGQWQWHHLMTLLHVAGRQWEAALTKSKGLCVLQQKQGLLLTLIYATFVKRIQRTCWSVIATTAARRLWVLENNIVVLLAAPAALPASVQDTESKRGR